MEQPSIQQSPNINYYKDVENQSESVQMMLRLGFIRKVYGILSFQLILTVIMCGLTFIDPIRSFYRNNLAIFWVCLAFSLIIIIPLICCRSVARQFPTNYIFLSVWTLCESYMVATCCSFYSPEIVITAASLTCAVTLSLAL